MHKPKCASMRLSCQATIPQPFPFLWDSQHRIVNPKMSILSLITSAKLSGSPASVPRPIFGAKRGKCDERWGYSTNAEHSHVHQHLKESDPGSLIDKPHRGLQDLKCLLSHFQGRTGCAAKCSLFSQLTSKVTRLPFLHQHQD